MARYYRELSLQLMRFLKVLLGLSRARAGVGIVWVV